MKKNKHPQMHPYEVTLTNGDVITLYTTIPGKKNVKLEIDIFNHPAWVGQSKGGMDMFTEVVKFKNKFKDLENL